MCMGIIRLQHCFYLCGVHSTCLCCTLSTRSSGEAPGKKQIRATYQCIAVLSSTPARCQNAQPLVRGSFRTKKSEHILKSCSYEGCSHFWDIFLSNHIFQLNIYRKRHRIRRSYSRCQLIIQNTPNKNVKIHWNKLF